MSRKVDNTVAREARRLVRNIAPMLVPHPQEVVAEAIAEVVARFIACHHPDVRAEVRANMIRVIDIMVPHVVEGMIKDGTPEDWRSPTMQ